MQDHDTEGLEEKEMLRKTRIHNLISGGGCKPPRWEGSLTAATLEKLQPKIIPSNLTA